MAMENRIFFMGKFAINIYKWQFFNSYVDIIRGTSSFWDPVSPGSLGCRALRPDLESSRLAAEAAAAAAESEGAS